jgi:hypothetical protein
MAKAEPAGMALRGDARRSGPWHGRPRVLPRIIQYTDEAVPSNKYPDRIVSPSRPATCCAFNMVNVGGPEEERGWLFQYRRCLRCGFSVRRILREIPDEATLANLRRALARSFTRMTGDAA